MSKSNRIKGAFDKVIGCRASSPERIESLALRTTGITERHAPTPRKGLPKMTKRMRKAMRSPLFKGQDEQHPLARKADVHERGYAKIMGLVSSVIHTPEQVI